MNGRPIGFLIWFGVVVVAIILVVALVLALNANDKLDALLFWRKKDDRDSDDDDERSAC